MRRMPLLALPAVIVIPVSAGIAAAQGDAVPPPADTLLHLSATGSVQVAPDELVADLVAQSTSSAAASAQRRVNEMIAAGMKTARGVAGIEARAIGYSVSPGDDKRATWTAQQTLELRGSDGPALLDLVGKLQGQGLAAASLDWQLSPALRRKAHDEATTAALQELQARAASTAAALGLHVQYLRDVRLDDSGFQPLAAPPPAMALMARSVPPPQATAAPEDVTAQVAADVVLRP